MGRMKVSASGGFPAIIYTFRKAFEAGGLFRFFTRMASKNACKTCALGMGGQKGGMTNEAGHFPEFCKKSVQAQAGDMQGAIQENCFATTSIRQLTAMTPQQLEKLGRLTFPVVARPGATHYERLSWEEAYAQMAKAYLDTNGDRVFFYASGRSSNEAAFLMQLVARAYGTPHINNCSFYCHQASGVALNMVYGSGTASLTLEDLEHADLAIVSGANPGSNHPRLITQLVSLRQRGGKVIVINPLKELGLVCFKIPSRPLSLFLGSKVSDLYLQPRMGGDIALYKAFIKGLMERDSVDHEYIQAYTQGWDEVAADIEATPWEVLIHDSGIPREPIDEAVDLLQHAQKGIFMWAMGLTHHAHGVDNILSLSNVALAKGWLGRPGTGLLPIRGHSNVQGIGTMGVAPELKETFARRLEAEFQMTLPKGRGMDTHACMAAAFEKQVDVAFLLGGNLYGSNPDAAWSEQAFQNIPLVINVSTKLNTGHAHGLGQTSIILPALARDEEAQSTTQESMFNFVRLSDGGTPAVPGEMKSEVEIIAELATRILPETGFDWASLKSHQALREAISAVVPGLEPLKDIGLNRQEFQIQGRTFHQPRFATPDGKGHFHVAPLPPLPADPDCFLLMTIRSEGQFNSVVYEDEDLYRGNTRRDVVMMNEADAQRLDFAEGDPVLVETEVGQMRVLISITDISPGSLAMYYPEANALVPRKLDPRSKTPAFKSVEARLRATTAI
jgi:molybdopterin-dependent oxidoreductase alpha subunit